MSTSDLFLRDDHLRALAMAVARNRAGPEDPIEEVLLRESVDPSDFDALLNDAVFKKYVTTFTAELQENGFSFAAKCRILAEDAIQHMYLMTKDPEVPAAARVKAVENLVEWGGMASKAAIDGSAGSGFHITFNIPNAPQQTASIRVAAPTAPTGLQMTFNAPTSRDTSDVVDAEDVTAVPMGVHSATELLTMTDVFPELVAHEEDDAYEDEAE